MDKYWEVEEFYILGDLPCCIIKITHPPLPPSVFPDRPYFGYPKYHWNGYMGVPNGHPWYGKDYDDIEPYSRVHGGLTYADAECTNRKMNWERFEYISKTLPPFDAKNNSDEFDQSVFDSIPKYIPIDPCPPYPYETGLDIWWFGFDTVHGGDWDEVTGEPNCTLEYVKADVERMVEAATTAWRESHIF